MEMIHRPEEQVFLALEEGAEVGRLCYARREGMICATHTLVPPEFGGRGIAALLVDALADYAREEQVRIHPVCSYVARRLEKLPEQYGDVTL